MLFVNIKGGPSTHIHKRKYLYNIILATGKKGNNSMVKKLRFPNKIWHIKEDYC